MWPFNRKKHPPRAESVRHEEERIAFEADLNNQLIEAFVLNFLEGQSYARTFWPIQNLWWKDHGVTGDIVAMYASIEAFREACQRLEEKGKILRVGQNGSGTPRWIKL